MTRPVIEDVVRASRALAAAGNPVAWSDPDEAKLKREQVWNPRQVNAGWQYLIRQAERTSPA
jgi:hypothetical protein